MTTGIIIWVIGWLFSVGIMVDEEPDHKFHADLILPTIGTFFMWPLILGGWVATQTRQ
jgi:hypothetical protein